MRCILGPKKCARLARALGVDVLGADYRGGTGRFRVWLTDHRFAYVTTAPPYRITSYGARVAGPYSRWPDYPLANITARAVAIHVL